eukprot:TRINITY_DN1825_c0_g2_i2.p1 TRINITY_DN1825_c0_g2~~TRINITY_DN1825_c0_g2_i2.p1  ORF type:complete len:495 (+),score=149.41 TRINITY_DN1825_c0_g2_i2:52-1485(+)
MAAAGASPQPPSAFPQPGKTYVHSRYEKLDTKRVIAAEHRIEVSDMLQEGTLSLRAIYRSKHVFSEYLKFVDPNFGGDAVHDFNITTPPPFDPNYVAQKPREDEEKKRAGDGDVAREKLRTTEDLVKKIHKRNAQLEVENKYLKTELDRREKEFESRDDKDGNGGVRIPDNEIGQIQRHPLMNRRMLRRCRSCPPSRVLLRTAIGGGRDAKRKKKKKKDDDDDSDDEKHAKKQAEDTGIKMLKHKVVSLTEALVSCQHENERLTKEKRARVSLRDSLIKKYLAERDVHIARLYKTLQEISEKVSNPMRLSRVKQPGANINPVVAANNMLREVSQKLTDQIASVTAALLRGGDTQAEELLQTTAQAAGETMFTATNPCPDTSGRKRELVRRVRTLVEGLPVPKKKQLLQVVMELKQVHRNLVESNRAIMLTYEDLKVRLNNELVQMKLEAAMLRDQVLSLGGRPQEPPTAVAAIKSQG